MRSCTSPRLCRSANRSGILPPTTGTMSRARCRCWMRCSPAGRSTWCFRRPRPFSGIALATPITEDHPTTPINPYGDTKLAVERALAHYARAYGLHSISLRYFNAAGADPDGVLGEDHTPEGHVIPRAIDAALGRDSFEVFGEDYATPDGTCLRDYVHVTDLAAAHLAALNGLRAGAATTVYNLGNGRPTSVRAILDSVERVTGGRCRTRLVRGVKETRPSCSRRANASGASSDGRRGTRISTRSSKRRGAGVSAIPKATQQR